mgnify:CR=1 FL=1|tara:strand:+ start:2534 stop:2722 length:189 start_codon:yes stop_codon:yes gene_type:complete
MKRDITHINLVGSSSVGSSSGVVKSKRTKPAAKMVGTHKKTGGRFGRRLKPRPTRSINRRPR